MVSRHGARGMERVACEEAGRMMEGFLQSVEEAEHVTSRFVSLAGQAD